MTKMPMLMLLCGSLLMAGTAIAGGNAHAGKAKADDACADCHGADGKGDADNPKLAGMSAQKFIKDMKEYKAGERPKSKKMTKAAKKLSDEDIADLAAYYAGLPK
jgi:cytochrome c553